MVRRGSDCALRIVRDGLRWRSTGTAAYSLESGDEIHLGQPLLDLLFFIGLDILPFRIVSIVGLPFMEPDLTAVPEFRRCKARERLRMSLTAADVGTWSGISITGGVNWSDNLERFIAGNPARSRAPSRASGKRVPSKTGRVFKGYSKRQPKGGRLPRRISLPERRWTKNFGSEARGE